MGLGILVFALGATDSDGRHAVQMKSRHKGLLQFISNHLNHSEKETLGRRVGASRVTVPESVDDHFQQELLYCAYPPPPFFNFYSVCESLKIHCSRKSHDHRCCLSYDGVISLVGQ